jgi:hypothetical protein
MTRNPRDAPRKSSKRLHALRIRRGELCPASAEDAGLSENGDCQIRVGRGYTYVFFFLYFKKIIRRAISMHIREREDAFNTIILQILPLHCKTSQPIAQISNRQLHVHPFCYLAFPIFLLLSNNSISNANPLVRRHLFLGPLIGARLSLIRLLYPQFAPLRNGRELAFACRQSLSACGAKWHDRGLQPTTRSHMALMAGWAWGLCRS